MSTIVRTNSTGTPMIGGVQTGGAPQAGTSSGGVNETPIPLLETYEHDALSTLPPPPPTRERPLEYGELYDYHRENAEAWDARLAALNDTIAKINEDISVYQDLEGQLSEILADDPDDVEAFQFRDASRVILDGLEMELAAAQTLQGQAETESEASHVGMDQNLEYADDSDFDGDGLINLWDADNDNDGITDAGENLWAGRDLNGDGVIEGLAERTAAAGYTDLDGDGQISVSEIQAAQSIALNVRWEIDGDRDGLTDAGEWWIQTHADPLANPASLFMRVNPLLADGDADQIRDGLQIPDAVVRAAQGAGFGVYSDGRVVGDPPPPPPVAGTDGDGAATEGIQWPSAEAQAALRAAEETHLFNFDISDPASLFNVRPGGHLGDDATFTLEDNTGDVFFDNLPTDVTSITFRADPDHQDRLWVEIRRDGSTAVWRYEVRDAFDNQGHIERRIWFANEGDEEIIFNGISPGRLTTVGHGDGPDADTTDDAVQNAIAGIHWGEPVGAENVSYTFEPFAPERMDNVTADERDYEVEGEGTVQVTRYTINDDEDTVAYMPEQIDGIEVKKIRAIDEGDWITFLFQAADGRTLGGIQLEQSAIAATDDGNFTAQVTLRLANNGQYLDAVGSESPDGDGGLRFLLKVEGGAGHDMVRAWGGHIDLGGGWDFASLGEGRSHVYGRAGNDIIVGAGRLDAFGGEGNDVLVFNYAGDALDVIDNSHLNGEGGHDWLIGGDTRVVRDGGIGFDLADGTEPDRVFNSEIGIFDDDGTGAAGVLEALASLANQNEEMAGFLRDYMTDVFGPMAAAAREVAADAITQGAMAFVMRQEDAMMGWFQDNSSPFALEEDGAT